MKKILSFFTPLFFLCAAFVVWLILFRGYFLRETGFTSDAISYYEHIQFFLKSLSHGEFPFWDPYWSGGSPNDFFLRRICPYNPLYLCVLLIYKLGVPFDLSYLILLSGYVFLAALGMYVLAQRLTEDSPAAFLSAIVLLFSALSTRIFDSYMLFVTVPLLWFFYFLVSFFKSPGRYNALGVTFCLMLLLTTYIPFYFFISVLSLLLVFCVFCIDRLSGVVLIFASFLRKEKWFVLFCLMALVLVSLPGAFFFHEAAQGQISLAGRHYNTTERHTLAVQNQAEDSWAVPEEFYYAVYFSDLRRIILAIVYIPGFAFILTALGFGLRVSRLMLLLVVWGGFILLFSSPFASPLYSFLREKVFFFKFIRNLHFLLWFVLIPLLALFIGEQFRVFRQAVEKGNRVFLLTWIMVVHAGLFFYLLRQTDALFSTYSTLGLSLLFFLGYVALPLMRKPFFVCAALLLLVSIQPIEVYSYLAVNSQQHHPVATYDSYTGRIAYQSAGVGETKNNVFPGDVLSKEPDDAVTTGIYYTTAFYAAMRAAVSVQAVSHFERIRFRAYDEVRLAKDGNWDWNQIENAMRSDANFVWVDSVVDPKVLPTVQKREKPLIFDRSTEIFQILHSGVNGVKLLSRFDRPQFLVWTDAYYPSWRAEVNGRPVKVFCVNGAYKGVLVPSGEAVVTLQCAKLGRYVYELFLMGLFNVFIIVLLVVGFRRRILRG